MTYTSNWRLVAAIVVAACMAVPASAAASTGSPPPTFRSDAAQSGEPAGTNNAWPPADFKGGDRAQSATTARAAFPPAGFRGGDSPVDHPGASRAAIAAPTTIEVVRPERTIAREVDEALPLILSGAALLLVLAGIGITLGRVRFAPRSH
jgi:hypothetical protein